MAKRRVSHVALYALLFAASGFRLLEGCTTGPFHFSRVGIDDAWATSPYGYLFTGAILILVTTCLGLMLLIELLRSTDNDTKDGGNEVGPEPQQKEPSD